MMTFFLGFETGGFQLVVSKAATEFSLGGFEMGWMIAAQYIAIIAMPLLLGGFADRVGKKRVLVAFLIVFVLGCAVAAASPSSVVFILGIFVVGCGYSICESTSSAALADQYGDRSHKQLNLVQCCFSLGAVCGPLLTDWVMTRFHMGWRIVFVLAGTAYLLLLPLLICTKISRTVAPVNSEKGADSPRAPRLLTSPLFLCLLASIVIYVGLENGVAFFLDSFFTREMSAQTISALSISLFWLSTAGSRLAIGIFSFSKRILVICFGASAGLLALLAVVRLPFPAIVICCLLGMLFGPVWPTLISLASREYPEHSGRATNTMVAGCGVGGALSPVLLGGIMDAGGMNWVFASLALIAAAGCAIFISYLYIKSKG